MIQYNSPCNLMVRFFHLHCNVIHSGYDAISGRNYKIAQNLLYMLDYFNY